MKQTKIKSFIKFIGTLSSKSRQSQGITMDNAIHDRAEQWQQLHYNTIGMDEGKNKHHAIILHKTNQCIVQKCQVGSINREDRNIKHRYEDKKSLYQAYRNSLHKKSEQLQLANNKFISKLNSIRQSQSFQKQPLFPSRTNKIESIKATKAHQKIFSNRSISINPYESARKTSKLHSKQKSESLAKEEKYLRKMKLDYKPIFRVKKVTLLENYRTETAPPHQNQQFKQVMSIKKQRQSLANKLKIKTQPIHEYSKIISFRDKRRNKNNGMLNATKVGGWDYDDSEQICKIFQ